MKFRKNTFRKMQIQKELVHKAEVVAEGKTEQKKDVFLTKDDKVDMIKWMVGF